MSDVSTKNGATPHPTTAEAGTEKMGKGGPKKKKPLLLHPLQEKAIRYTTFMLTEEGKPQTADAFVQEAIARHLAYVQKHGVEFPPKMLAELTRLNLLK